MASTSNSMSGMARLDTPRTVCVGGTLPQPACTACPMTPSISKSQPRRASRSHSFRVQPYRQHSLTAPLQEHRPGVRARVARQVASRPSLRTPPRRPELDDHDQSEAKSRPAARGRPVERSLPANAWAQSMTAVDPLPVTRPNSSCCTACGRQPVPRIGRCRLCSAIEASASSSNPTRAALANPCMCTYARAAARPRSGSNRRFRSPRASVSMPGRCANWSRLLRPTGC